MPERELDPSLARLAAMANEPELLARVEEEAAATLPVAPAGMSASSVDGVGMSEPELEGERRSDQPGVAPARDSRPANPRRRAGEQVGREPVASSSPWTQVLGVLLGSPEFQQH
jgi:hypothetical protein